MKITSKLMYMCHSSTIETDGKVYLRIIIIIIFIQQSTDILHFTKTGKTSKMNKKTDNTALLGTEVRQDQV